MSAFQQRIRKEDIFGTADIPRISLPAIRCTVRSTPPDGNHSEYYWTNLATKTLQLQITGDVSVLINMTFTANTITAVLADIAAASPGNLVGDFEDGYLVIKSLRSGNKNKLLVLDGTSMAILGLLPSPAVSGVSVAGEIAPQPANSYQSPNQVAKLITKGSLLDDVSINKAIASVANLVESYISDLDRMLATPVTFITSTSNGVFTLPGTDEIYIGFTTQTNPGADALNPWISFSGSNKLPVYINGVKARVVSATYGPLTATNAAFSNWSVADGKSLYGPSSHWRVQKTSATIQSIRGNVIYAPGANFITSACMENNTVLISGATNTAPFSHNGEFLVDRIIDENTISIKIKSPADDLIQDTNAPSGLNPNLSVGQSFGTVAVLIGKFVTLAGKADLMYFQVNPIPPDGTYYVTAAVGRTGRTVGNTDLATLLNKEVGALLELGSKYISTTSDALLPRLMLTSRDSGSLTLMFESRSGTGTAYFRMYVSPLYGIHLTLNAKWSGTSWSKDTDNAAAYQLVLSTDGMLLQNRQVFSNGTWTSWDNSITVPLNDLTGATAATIHNGLKLGTSMVTTNAQAESPRLIYSVKNNTFTCLSELIKEGDGYRTYIGNKEYFTTVAAKWVTDHWVRDLGLTVSPLKVVIGPDGLAEYTCTKSSFTDDEWVPKLDLANWTWDEEFVTARTLSAATGPIDDLTTVAALTNAKVAVGAVSSSDPIENGSLILAADTAGDFSASVRSLIPVSVGSSFVLSIRVCVLDKTILTTALDAFAPGIFIGIKNVDGPPADPSALGIATGNNVSQWILTNGLLNTYNTTINNNNGSWHQFIITAVNNVINIYGDGVLVYTAATDANTLIKPNGSAIFITAKGTAASNGQNICYVDFVKYRSIRPNRF
jgi:hypothetical protein